MLLDPVKQSTEAYHLNAEGGISGLGTALTQEIWGMRACITKSLHRVCRDVLDSGEGPSSQ